MFRNYLFFYVLLSFGMLACQSGSGTEAAVSVDGAEYDDGRERSAATETMSQTTSDRPQLCEWIMIEALSAVTGGQYADTHAQADYANIAHCDYLGGASSSDSASLLFAIGDTANQRWESAQMFEPSSVEGFWDKACWEPARGTFAAQSGDKYVEVRLSKSHGDESTRIETAKKLAELVLSKL